MKPLKFTLLVLFIIIIFPTFSIKINFSTSPAFSGYIFAQTSVQIDPFYKKLLEEGKYFYNNSNYQEAIKNFEIALFGLLDDKSKSSECYIYLTVCHYQIKNLEKSKFFHDEIKRLKLHEYLKALNLPKNLMDKYYEIASYFSRFETQSKIPASASSGTKAGSKTKTSPFSKEIMEAGIEQLKEAIKNNKRNFEAYFRLSAIYLEQKKIKNAKSVLKDLIEVDSRNSNAYFELGKIFVLEKEFNKALEAYKKAAPYLSDNIELHYEIAKIYYELKNYQKAKQEFLRVQEIYKTYKDTEKYITLIEEKEKPKTEIKDEAKVEKDPVKALEKSIKASPCNVSLYYELFELHTKNNNLKAAKKTIENLVKNNPYEINGLYLLGKINFAQRKYKEAEKSFEKIVTLSRRVQTEESVLVETKAYLILSSYLGGDREKAQKVASELMGIFSPEKISSLALDAQEKERLGRIIKTYQAQFEAERKKRKIKYLEEATEKQPKNTALFYELYDLYRDEKNVKASTDIIQKLLKNNPNDMKGYFLLGKNEFAQNHFLEAQRHFNRILAASNRSDVNWELVLKSIIYTSICFHRLNKKEDAQKFIQYLYNSTSEEEIQRAVKEEGLEEEWKKIIRKK